MTAFRALARIARRSLLRDRWRALLVVVLIGLPVMGITTSALLLETAIPTPEERATRAMGRADLRVEPTGSFGRAELTRLLPDGSTVEPIWSDGDRVVVAGMRQAVMVRNLDPDGIATGMVTMLEGRAPSASDEVVVSDRLATLAGAGIGDTITLEDGGAVRIVGRFEDPRNLTALTLVGDPALAEANDRVPVWLVELPPGASDENVANDVASASDPAFEAIGQSMFSVVTRAQAGEATETFVTLVVVMGSLALVEAALVASAAFAVGIRRRQRELGLIGAAGATPRQLAGSVLAEGMVAGVVAVVAGSAAGLGVAWLVSLRLDELTGARTGALELNPVVLFMAGLVGLIAALVAAAVPAWGAARLPTLVALSGRRPPSTPARRLLALGVGLIAIAVSCTVAAPLVGGTGDTLALLLLVVGAVTGVLGFGACSPWLLERMEGVARRLPLAPRVALRDTARARTRNGPIVTAVLASVAGTIALAAILASQQAQSAQFWRPGVASDSLMIRGAAPETSGARVAQELNAVGSGPDRSSSGPNGAWYYTIEMPLLHPDVANDLVETWMDFRVGDESLLLAYHGDAALEAFRDGTTVVLQSPDDPVAGPTGTVYQTDETTGSTRVAEIPVVTVPARGDPVASTTAIMPTATAERLGLEIDQGQVQYLVRLDHDVTGDDLSRAGTIASSVDPDAHVEGPLPPPDPMLGFRLLMLVGALAAALTVTGIAVALGEVEARADQRTLLALGAPRGLRRRITASRALVIAALAGLLAVPAGLLPVWGVLVPIGWPIVVPLPEVAAALLVLPLAAVAGGLLLGRPLPEWAARREAGV